MLCKEESPSRVSAITDIRDIGLYDVPMLMSLFGLGIGMMLANFQTCGILLSLIAALYMFVRYCSPFLPMFLRCLMLTLSGPVELLFLLFLIAARTCSVVMLSCCHVGCRLSTFLVIFLFVVLVL